MEQEIKNSRDPLILPGRTNSSKSGKMGRNMKRLRGRANLHPLAGPQLQRLRLPVREQLTEYLRQGKGWRRGGGVLESPMMMELSNQPARDEEEGSEWRQGVDEAGGVQKPEWSFLTFRSKSGQKGSQKRRTGSRQTSSNDF